MEIKGLNQAIFALAGSRGMAAVDQVGKTEAFAGASANVHQDGRKTESQDVKGKPARSLSNGGEKPHALAIDALAAVFGAAVDPIAGNATDTNHLSADVENWASDILVEAPTTQALIAAEFLASTPAAVVDAIQFGAAADEVTDVDAAPPHAGDLADAEEFELKLKLNYGNPGVMPLPMQFATVDLNAPVADVYVTPQGSAVDATAGAAADIFVPNSDANPQAADVVDGKTFAQMIQQLAADVVDPKDLVGANFSAYIDPIATPQPPVDASNLTKAQPANDVDLQAADVIDPRELDAYALANAADSVDPKAIQAFAEDVSADVYVAPTGPEGLAADVYDVKSPTYSYQPSADIFVETADATGIQSADVFDPKSVPNFTQAPSVDTLAADELLASVGEAADVYSSNAETSAVTVAPAAPNMAADVHHAAVDAEFMPADINMASTAGQPADLRYESVDEVAVSQLLAADVDSLESDSYSGGSTIDSRVDAVNPLSAPNETKRSENLAAPSPALSVKQASNLLHHVADRLEALAAARPSGGVRIQLNPADLGSLTLVVRQSGKNVSAEIFASHDGVRAALEATKPELNRVLDVKGLNLNSVTISQNDVASRSFADAQTRSFQQSAPNPLRLGTYDEPVGQMTADQIRQLSRNNTGVDLWI
jgi:hypothetical protein